MAANDEGIDFSWARPGGPAINAAGKKFVMRYLYPDGPGGKGLDSAEVTDYLTHGLQIGTVFESSGGRALNGYTAGVADAGTAAHQLAELGMSGNVVYFAVDFDATPDQYETIGQYLDGAASVRGKNVTGLYAGYGPINALCGGVRADYGWQAYAWSHGLISGKANLYQYLNGQTLNGGSVDYCRALTDNIGAHSGTTTASTGTDTPTTPTTPKEDPMITLSKATDGPAQWGVVYGGTKLVFTGDSVGAAAVRGWTKLAAIQQGIDPANVKVAELSGEEFVAVFG